MRSRRATPAGRSPRRRFVGSSRSAAGHGAGSAGRRWILAVALLVTLTSAPGLAAAQAWIRDPGHGFAGVGVTALSGRDYRGPDQASRELPTTYRQTTVHVHTELGLVERWLMATFSGEVYRRNQLDDQGATSGLGDLRAGLFTGLVTAPFRLSAGVLVGLPTGDDEPNAEPGADPEARLIARSLPTGDGELDVEPRLVAGALIDGDDWPLRHYAVASAGYALRTEGFADAVTWRVEFGSRYPRGFGERIWLVARAHGVESFASDEEAGAGVVGLGDGTTYGAAGAELSVDVAAGFGVSAAVETAFRARNILVAWPVTFAARYVW